MKKKTSLLRCFTSLGILALATAPSFLASCIGTTSETETGTKISLKGKVLGEEGAPYPGMLARLARVGLADTTDALGRYLIEKDTSIADPASPGAVDTLGFYVDGRRVYALGITQWVDSLLDVEFAAPGILAPSAAYTRTAVAGDTVSFDTWASGLPKPTYQWQMRPAGATAWQDIPGATGLLHPLGTVALSDSGKAFRALACNFLGCDTTVAMSLTVLADWPDVRAAIEWPDAPYTRTATAGDTTSFSVLAAGRPAPAFQWQVRPADGTAWQDIDGATQDRFFLDSVAPADDGKRFRAIACNRAGCDTSRVLELEVVP